MYDLLREQGRLTELPQRTYSGDEPSEWMGCSSHVPWALGKT